ncbi:MAG TPA: HPr-rel-A system PqqD family peptide chaperone [Sphingomicrobium sp.]|nr:HPr-rel-A system PqqD family peptide chaperone [Sphingomicrobium sp.]
MTSVSKQADRFTETDIDDEIVVMRLDSGDFYSLSGSAAAIWRLIDGTRDRATLIADLKAEYDADEASIESDVDEFLAELREMGLIAPL